MKRFLSVEPQTAMERTVQMVSIIQHKTKCPVTVPLNTLALSLLPPRPENGEDGIIFPLVKKPDNVAKYVRRTNLK